MCSIMGDFQSIAHNFMLTFYNFHPCVGTQWLFVKNTRYPENNLFTLEN